MTEKPLARFQATWDELETAVHVPVEDQVAMQEVSVAEPVATPEELDEKHASGMAGGVPVRR